MWLGTEDGRRTKKLFPRDEIWCRGRPRTRWNLEFERVCGKVEWQEGSERNTSGDIYSKV